MLNVKKKVAFAFSSGGAKGLAHIGVLKAFLDYGFEVVAISGSSMGAVVGAFYGFGFSPDEMIYISDKFGGKISTFLKAAVGSRGGPGTTMADVVRRYLGNLKVGDSALPVYIYATDLLAGRCYLFKDEDPLDIALAGSTSIPGVLPPVRYKDMYLSDGGISIPLPTPILRQKHSDEDTIIVAVNVYSGTSGCKWHLPRAPIVSEISVAFRAYFLLMDKATRQYAEFADYTISPPLCRYSAMDFARAKAIAQIGYDEAEKLIVEKLLVGSV